MNIALQILVEGEADTVFIDFLGFENTKAGSSGNVANVMKEKLATRLALGIVDDDKGKVPKYFSEFELKEEKDDLLLKKHKSRKHYLIIIQPALETWLLEAADQVGIKTERYGFKNLKQLKRVTKSQKVKKNQKFKDFLNTLKQKKGTPTKTICKWIEDIIA
ncbi:MAG: hypothetical protein AAF806_01695 [Bacteroidota bacterium]